MGNEELVGGVVAGKYRLDEHLRPGRFGDFWRGTRLSDKEALSALLQEDAKASYLRRKKLQGKAQFDMPDNSTPSK